MTEGTETDADTGSDDTTDVTDGSGNTDDSIPADSSDADGHISFADCGFHWYPVILTKTREKVEKQQALYHQYRSRLEALKNGLDCIFAECPPEENTRDLHGKPQRPGQIQADGPEEAGLREQP